MDGQKACKRYVLNPTHALRGWLMLPYAVQHAGSTTSEFLTKHNYTLLLDCDGQTDIAYDELPEEDRDRYDFWEKGKIIRRCDGEDAQLLPEQKYRYYNSRFKESVHWSITGKCNYRCRHCFMSARTRPRASPAGTSSWSCSTASRAAASGASG